MRAISAPWPLPQGLDPKARECRIVGDEHEVVEQGLRRQNTVEGIAVSPRQESAEATVLKG